MAEAPTPFRMPARSRHMRARELGFSTSAKDAPLPEYKPMFDVHLTHLWKNPRMRSHLQAQGFLDDSGQPVDIDTHRRKLFVIEQELAQADTVERQAALEKERRLRDRQIHTRRQETAEKQLRQVQNQIEARRQKSQALREAASCWTPSGDAGSRSASSLPAIGGGGRNAPQSGRAKLASA